MERVSLGVEGIERRTLEYGWVIVEFFHAQDLAAVVAQEVLRLQQVVDDGAAFSERPDVALFALGIRRLEDLNIFFEPFDKRSRVLCCGVGYGRARGSLCIQHACAKFRLGQEKRCRGKDRQNDKYGKNVFDFIHPA